MLPPNTNGMRRRPPSITTTVDYTEGHLVHHSGASFDYVNKSPTTVSLKSKTMYDVVIKSFHRRSADGEIFNNPMLQTSEVLSAPLVRVAGPPNSVYFRSYMGKLPNSIPEFKLDKENDFLIDNAVTDAFAKVSANDGNTLLWLGEFKETLAMFKDICSRTQMLIQATKAQRKAWRKGQLSVEGQQKLTLALLYGILPLEESIAQFLEGLFKTKAAGRHTARAVRIHTDSKLVNTPARRDNNYYIDYYHWATYTETLELQVRSGILYDVALDAPWVSVILDPKSVISTAYALARLSFVVDWIINVGGTLAAWSPSVGTDVLASWVTVEKTHTIQGVNTYGPSPGSKNSGQYGEGSGEFSRELTTKWRKPIDRSDLPVIPRLDINLNMSKVLSMVLLFAKVKKDI